MTGFQVKWMFGKYFCATSQRSIKLMQEDVLQACKESVVVNFKLLFYYNGTS